MGLGLSNGPMPWMPVPRAGMLTLTCHQFLNKPATPRAQRSGAESADGAGKGCDRLLDIGIPMVAQVGRFSAGAAGNQVRNSLLRFVRLVPHVVSSVFSSVSHDDKLSAPEPAAESGSGRLSGLPRVVGGRGRRGERSQLARRVAAPA